MAGEVVLGYDGQEGSKAALSTATNIAAAFKRPLVIVFGYKPIQMGGEVGDLARAVKELGETMTAEAVEAAKAIDASIDVQVELVDDRPAEALLRAADEHDALALVVGGTNQGPISGRLMGSVTYQVVHRSSRPVVVVPFASE
jgi:nucleotide-binding universal stress UspA family protein